MPVAHDAKAYQCIRNIPVPQTPGIRHELYKKSAVIFRSLHEDLETDQGVDRKRLQCLYSEKYLSILKDYIELLKRQGNRETASERQYCKRLLAIWELCQIVFFKDQSSRLGILLLEWLNVTDKSWLKYDIQGIFNCGSPSEHHDFWPLIYKLILHRNIQKLLEFIAIVVERITVASDRKSLELLKRLVIALPDLPDTGSDVTFFHRYKWEYWRWKTESEKQIQQYIATNLADTLQHTNLRNALNLLLGNADTVVNLAEDPTEAVIAMLAYTNPAASKNDVHTLAREVSNSRRNHALSEKQVSHFNVLLGNISQALEPLATIDIWPITHLIDLLSIDGDYKTIADMPIKLFSEEDNRLHEVEYRNLFVLLHARYLMHHKELQSYSELYFDTCGIIGSDCRKEYNDCAQNV